VGPGAGLDRCGKSRPAGIRSPDLSARSESLYRLRYPGSRNFLLIKKNPLSMDITLGIKLCLESVCIYEVLENITKLQMELVINSLKK
jgi:hypothetical protein